MQTLSILTTETAFTTLYVNAYTQKSENAFTIPVNAYINFDQV